MKKRHVYISGPMTGLPALNFPAFNAAAHALRLLGYQVTNPAELKTDTTGLAEDLAWRAYMRADIKALMDCDDIVMLPGWMESRGAVLERDIAIRLGMQDMSVTDAVIRAPQLVESATQATQASITNADVVPA